MIICAELRNPPSSGYLLLEDHPAKATPYTPMDVMAKRNIKPIFTFATISCVGCPRIVIVGGPKGISAMVVSASDNAKNGASTYRNLSAPGGVTSSLERNLTPSASGCSNPCAPT